MKPASRAHVRRAARRTLTAAAALGLIAGWSAPAIALTAESSAIRAAVGSAGGSREIRDFYRSRSNAPLWIRDGAIGVEAYALLSLLETAEIDGLDPEDYEPEELHRAIARARDGSPRALARAEMLLSRRFVEFARDLRRPRNVGMLYADRELAPKLPDAGTLLAQAAKAPSLRDYLAGFGWMNPVYARLRTAGAGHVAVAAGPLERDRLRLNLDRARALPADLGPRFVLVDAASARLWMYEKGHAVGTMRVVVGKPESPTPMMAALIRYANVNPYWNIPPDLVATRVAAGALRDGARYLKARNFEVLSGWSHDAAVVDPTSIDWRAVAAGTLEVRVRQRPGPANAMGRIKFMFPNELGVYLHDTPDRNLLREEERLFSAGCVRVEDAPRLARWLFGKPVPLGRGKSEQRIDLGKPVPVYITYLTAAVEGERLVFRPDVYDRDGLRMTAARGGGAASR